MIKHPRKKFSAKYREKIANNYGWKCQNIPGKLYTGLSGNSKINNRIRKYYNFPDYKCPLYQNGGSGYFGNIFEIDHEMELQNGGSNQESNLKPLCLTCHRVKTNRMREFNSKSKLLVPKLLIDNYDLEKDNASLKFDILKKRMELADQKHAFTSYKRKRDEMEKESNKKAKYETQSYEEFDKEIYEFINSIFSSVPIQYPINNKVLFKIN